MALAWKVSGSIKHPSLQLFLSVNFTNTVGQMSAGNPVWSSQLFSICYMIKLGMSLRFCLINRVSVQEYKSSCSGSHWRSTHVHSHVQNKQTFWLFFVQWLVDLAGTKIWHAFQGRVSAQKRNLLGLPDWQTTPSSLKWKQLEVRRGWGEASGVLGPHLLSFKDLLMATVEKKVFGQKCERNIHAVGYALQLKRFLTWGGCVTCGTGVLAALYGCSLMI